MLRGLRRGGALAALLLLVHAGYGADAAPIVPRLDEGRPVIDGVLTDACWQAALVISNFCLPESELPVAQALEVRITHDTRYLFVSAICVEADTNRIVATRSEEDDCVWCDDSFEIWVGDPQDRSRSDQFITSPLGTRQTELKPLPNGVRIRPQWKVASRLVAGAWVTEMSIPFTDLGRDAGPVPGEALQLKLGREDYTVGEEEPTYAVWPPLAPYGKRGDFGVLYFVREGFLQNVTFDADAGAVPRHWDSNAGAGFVRRVDDEDGSVGYVTVPGHYATLEQVLDLPRNRLFALACETRGLSGGYLRARTGPDPGVAVTARIEPSEEWEPREILFQTDASGRASIILGCTDDNEPGNFRLRNLRLEEVLMRTSIGEAVPADLKKRETLVVEGIRVVDSRVVRGFCGTPVDGTTHSWDWALRPWEYNMPGLGSGVRYVYRGNDGLHVELADAHGIDAIQVRGGIHATVVTDCKQFDDPDSGTWLCEMEGRARNSYAHFRDAVKSSRVSFFDVRDGVIGDISFLRVSERRPRAEATLRFALVPGSMPADLTPFLSPRYSPDDRQTLELAPWGGSEDDAASAPSNRVADLFFRDAVQLVSAPLERELPLTAVAIRGRWSPEAAGVNDLTVTVQDPVNPFAAVMTATVGLKNKGDLDLVLDFPDQVLQPGQRLWITLDPGGGLRLRDAVVEALVVGRDEAVASALPFHLLRMRDHYARMSEARPWNNLRDRETMYTTWAAEQGVFWTGVEPLLRSLAHCRLLAPDDPVSKEYDAWIYRGVYRREKVPTLRPAVIPEDEGAPRWARVARAAWMHTRAVPQWWFAARGLPNGEVGTDVNDDTDFYQNMVNFPMFERDGVGGDVLENGARLWRLAVEGGYLEEGLNANREDPLHAYEEGINHEAVMPWWFYGDPVYVEQCMVAARSTEALTTVNAAGHRHFKSAVVSSADLRNPRPDEFDGSCHAQMMHPVQAVAWYSRNPRALKFLREYSESWMAHMQTPGRYATQVETATDIELAHEMEPYREGMAFQMSVMMTAAETLGDARFMQPVVDYFQRREPIEFLEGFLTDLDALGYLAAVTNADDYLAKSDPILRWRRQGDKAAIEGELETAVAELQTYGRMYTTAEPFSDRVFLNHARRLTAPSVAYTGGYATRNKSFHSHAVSWDGFSTNYAALVRTGNHETFETLLFNFSEEPLVGEARFWLLEHGLYRLEQGIDSDGDDLADRNVATSPVKVVRGEPVPLTLAPRAVTVLRLTRQQSFESLFGRADLALAASELTIVGDRVQGVVHNIGNKTVEAVVVVLLDEQGVERARATLGALEAPVDLFPRRMPFALSGLVEAHAGWTVRVDPAGVVDEITEINNSLAIP